jgi:hypothetical protein
MEACPRDAVVAAEVPLRLVPEVFDAVDVDLPRIGISLGVVDPQVMEFRDAEDVVGVQGVGIDDVIPMRTSWSLLSLAPIFVTRRARIKRSHSKAAAVDQHFR